MQIAAVATARKLAVLCWHLMLKGEDYVFALPSLAAHKRRKLELRAGLPADRGRKGESAGYSLKAVRAAERDLTPKAKPPTGPWSPPGSRTAPPANTTARKKMAVAAGRQQRDATFQARRLSGAAASAVPMRCSSLGGHPRPPQPERYRGPRRGQGRTSSLRCGRSTLTAAAGAGERGSCVGVCENKEITGPALTFSSVVRRWIQCSAG